MPEGNTLLYPSGNAPCPAALTAAAVTTRVHETYHFKHFAYDVTGLLDALADRRIHPKLETLPREWIECFAEDYMNLTFEGRSIDQRGSDLAPVSTQQALALPAEKLLQPVIIAYAGRNRGTLTLSGRSSPDHLLIDGHHRIARAYLDGLASLDVYILSERLSRAYRIR